jgi:hypothetical protein
MCYFCDLSKQSSKERFIACRRAPRRRVFYQSAAGRSTGTRAYALFLQPTCRWNSRISAARPVSIADNFLLKQQKQRERRFAKERCGSLFGISRVMRRK